jgi:hypothetical protein
MDALSGTSRLLSAAVLACGLCSCTRLAQPVSGGLYTVRDGQGFYRTAKVVALDGDGVHLRLYKNRWQSRPKTVDSSSLSLGTINDPDGFGIGHLVLSKEDFISWKPEFLSREGLTADELEGYRLWQQGRKDDFAGKP